MRAFLMRILPLAGYAVPYAFLCLYGDAMRGTLAFHLLSLVCLCVLARLLRGRIALLLAGNALSFLSSAFCLSLIQDERWTWYFKPFSAFQTLAALSLAALIIHLFLCLRRRD